MAGSIRLNVDAPRCDLSEPWPVTQGIPFPDGELRRGTPACVRTGSGDSLPTQTRCLATWGPDRAYVKWLLVDFQIPESHDPDQQTYALEYGEALAVPAPDTPVRFSETGGKIVVSNGVVELGFPAGGLDASGSPQLLAFLNVADPDGRARPLLRTPGLQLYMSDDTGVRYESSHGRLPAVLTIEERGSLRSCIKVHGYHTAPDGGRYCPYELRIHVFAGLPDLRLMHTYVFDQEPDMSRIAEIGINVPLHLSGHRHGMVGGERDEYRSSHFRRIALHQSNDDRYDILFDGRSVDEGERAPGWCALSGEAGGMIVALRGAWQEYPKGLVVLPDGIDVQLRPGASPPLDYANPYREPALRFDDMEDLSDDEFTRVLGRSATAPLNLKSIGLGHKDFGMPDRDAGERVRRLIMKYASNRTYCFCDTGAGKAYGSAKTHEIWLRCLSSPADAGNAGRFCDAAQAPVLALPSPEYVCGTGAVRLAHPVDRERFQETEDALERLYERLVLEPQRVCRIYGMLDYGELINGHTKANQIIYRSYRQDPSRWNDIIRVLGTFNNEAQDLIYQLWVYYLRTGRRAYFHFAEAKSEHTADVDFIQVDPADDDRRGLMHYHNVLNWSGGPSPSHSLIGGLMLHYYLTGNRRAFEVARGAADNAVRRQTPGGVVRGHGLNREVTGPLMTLIEVYEATWDYRYLTMIERTLEVVRRSADPETGALPVSLFTGMGEDEDEVWAQGQDNRTDYPGGMLCHVLFESHRLFGESWVQDWIIRLADSWLYDVRCDDYIPAELTRADPGKPTESVRVNKISDSWYWRSFLDYSNNYFDPVVALAYRITRDPKYLGYLQHRAEIFPERAREAHELFTCETFNAINHWGDAVPAVMGALADVDPDLIERANADWKAERARRGYPVYEGDRRGFDEEGNAAGTAMNVDLSVYGARDPERRFLFRYP